MRRLAGNSFARNITLLTALMLVFWSCEPKPAQAQTNTNCAPREVIVERLSQRYAETVQMMGLGGGRAFV